jgi:hypothetical protein
MLQHCTFKSTFTFTISSSLNTKNNVKAMFFKIFPIFYAENGEKYCGKLF